MKFIINKNKDTSLMFYTYAVKKVICDENQYKKIIDNKNKNINPVKKEKIIL